MKKSPTIVELRFFAGGLLILGGIVWLTASIQRPETLSVVSAGTLTGLGLLGLLRPDRIRMVYRGWMLLVTPIGWLVSHLVMAAIYFLVVTPIGLMRRVCGTDSLGRDCTSEAETFWEPIHQTDDPVRSFRQY
ncbi:SxtJ family membrane protein [Thalassoroseus pseudoceratinae]|uniref:SxtJ family membrane protein n=1 Tax=Thalassoroseus pseudoceratinae TaxID=2713176 RepID=UPI00141DA68D|nr:SxtJ family membrane protein [Thalassoroseus pseudoceratinae]